MPKRKKTSPKNTFNLIILFLLLLVLVLGAYVLNQNQLFSSVPRASESGHTINLKVSPIESGATSWFYQTKKSGGVICDNRQYGVSGWVDNVDFSMSETSCWQKNFVLDNSTSSSNFTWQSFDKPGGGDLEGMFLKTSSHRVQAWTCDSPSCRNFGPYEHEGMCSWTLQGMYNPNSTNVLGWLKTIPSGSFVLFAEVNRPPPVYNCN